MQVVKMCRAVAGGFQNDAQIVEVESEATHVILPDLENYDDGTDYCRTVEVRVPDRSCSPASDRSAVCYSRRRTAT